MAASYNRTIANATGGDFALRPRRTRKIIPLPPDSPGRPTHGRTGDPGRSLVVRSARPERTPREAPMARQPVKPTRRPRTPAAPRPRRPAGLVAPTVPSKFALYDLRGRGRAWYLVEPAPVQLTAAAVAPTAHHVIAIDRSGSTYGSLDGLKEGLLRLLTLDEHSRADTLVSLISYSSQGDVTTHFERVPVRRVMATGSHHQHEIRRLRPAGLTCVSQALRAAGRVVLPGELTAVSL